MSVAIISEKKNKRITCDVTFDLNFDDVLDLFRTIDNHFWVRNDKVWSFTAEPQKKTSSGT